MTEYTHTTIGLCVGIILSNLTHSPIDQSIEITMGCMLGADIADVDQSIKFIRHRGITHSLAVPVAVFVLNWYYPSWALVGFIIGLLTHIAADLLNGKGVELFAPLSKRNYIIMDLKYDGEGERVLRILTFSLMLVYVSLDVLKNF